MAKKVKKVKEPVAPVEGAPAEAVPVADTDPVHPDTHIGVDHGANGTDYSYHEVDNRGRQRTHNVGHKTVEHVDTDANGVWLYRKLD